MGVPVFSSLNCLHMFSNNSKMEILQERGRCKEEEFMKKLQQMAEEEEKMRIPVAQGLPWTTDEPEVSCLYWVMLFAPLSVFMYVFFFCQKHSRLLTS